MAVENEIDRNLEDDSKTEEGRNKIQERLTDLSNKVKLTAKERDEQSALVKNQAEEIAQLKRDNEFNNSFSEVSGKFSNASQFKDKIREKVLAGYSVEDATVSVLNREGKLSTPEPEREQIAARSSHKRQHDALGE